MSSLVCPYCRTLISGESETCSGCATQYHLDCSAEAGECIMPGCAGRVKDVATVGTPQGLTCHSCSAALGGSSKFCGRCGASRNLTAPAPQVSSLAVGAFRRCNMCGTEASPAAVFCRKCGGAIMTWRVPTSPSPTPPPVVPTPTPPVLPSPSTPPAVSASEPDLVEKLKELKSLLDAGVLNDVEFQQAKAKLLS